MSLSPKTNCAGQSCAERDGCRRYVERIPMRWEEVAAGAGTVKVPHYEWASFDVERAMFGGCVQRIAA